MERRNFLAAGLGLPALQQNAANRPKLQFRPLGKTGLKVTSLGFGAMLASDQAVLERAFDAGINYFDTARSYQSGNNERMVGAALKGKRQKVVLSSKSGGKTRQDALRDLDASLKEIGTDYLDVWFLHAKSTAAEVTDELLEAQRAAKEAGKIRFAGVSVHFNMPDMLPFLVKRGQTDIALVSYNFTMKPDVGEAIRAARKAGMGIVAMKVMAGGYARIKRGDRLYGMNPDSLLGTLKKEGAMLAALKWTLRNESVDTAIIGITDFDELDENLRAMSEPFKPEDGAKLAMNLRHIMPVYCRMCGDCGGTCDKGVAIADTLRCLTYAEGYGQFAMARERYLELPVASRAANCADCAECSVRCAHGVHVREGVSRAQTLLS